MTNGQRISKATEKLVGITLNGEQVKAAVRKEFGKNVTCYPSDAAGELKDGKLIARVGRKGNRTQYTYLALQFVARDSYKVVPLDAQTPMTGNESGGSSGMTSEQADASIAALIAERDSKNPAPANVVAAQRSGK